MPASKPRLAFLIAAFLIGTSALAQDGAAGKAKAAQCFACHGADGQAKIPDAPNLSGQNDAYLVKALGDYRSGARTHEVMSLMAKNLSDEDIRQLAGYFSGIRVTVGSR